MNHEHDRAPIYTIVANDEEQYSIWPSHRALPNGWRSVGQEGPKAECLAYIERVWTDMRPKSLRAAMAHPTTYVVDLDLDHPNVVPRVESAGKNTSTSC